MSESSKAFLGYVTISIAINNLMLASPIAIMNHTSN